MIRNVILDWSGTLVDDLPAVWRATNYVLAKAERAEMTLEQFRAEFCLPFTGFYDRHIPHIPLPQLEDWFHSHFRQVQDSVCALPHAEQFLEFCRAHGVRMFLLSTIHRDHFKVQSLVTGFEKYFEKAYVNIWDKRKKIHEILTENRLEPEETMFIGDMEHDIETAKHGRIHSCAVLTGYNTLQQLRLAAPDLIVEHLGELGDILERYDSHLEAGSRAEDNLRPTVTVGALIFNSTGEVLVVRTHKWSDLWGIPGGKIKWGEPSEAALQRELKEETGLEIGDIKFVMVQDCIHSKEFYRDAHFILLNYTCRCSGPADVILNDEARDFRWVAIEQALELPVNEPTRRLLLQVKSVGLEEPASRSKKNA
jgi:phosphoglycolate phosphatase-like HAD superfamily hydrolase/ADP-ribose pyrophosphatase YjhB (NUDIX family)